MFLLDYSKMQVEEFKQGDKDDYENVNLNLLRVGDRVCFAGNSICIVLEISKINDNEFFILIEDNPLTKITCGSYWFSDGTPFGGLTNKIIEIIKGDRDDLTTND